MPTTIARIGASCLLSALLSCTLPGPNAVATLDANNPVKPSAASQPSSAIDTVSASYGPWTPLFEGTYEDTAIIDEFLAAIRTASADRTTILLETTLDWGCPCPTWVFPFHQDMSAFHHVMVMPSPSLDLDPTDVALPEIRFRLTGHFTGFSLSGFDWVKARGRKPPSFPRHAADDPAVQAHWRNPGFVFVVESWCFADTHLLDDKAWLIGRGATSCSA